MKSRTLIILLFFILTSPALIKAQVSIGVIGGVNLQSVSGDAPPDISYGTKPGYMFGLSAEMNVTKDIRLVIQPNYTLSQTKISFDIGEPELKDSFSVKMNYIRVPVLAKIEALNGVTYFISGFDLGFLQNAKSQDINKTVEEKDITDRLESFDLAAQFGLGVKFPVRRFRIGIEGRYSQSLLNLGKGTDSTLPLRFRLSGFLLLTNFSYNF